MKTSQFVTFCGALSCTAIWGSSAKAASFSSADSKHAFLHPLFGNRVYENFDKFQWLSSADDQSASSVNRIIVSLEDQRLYAYHDQQLLAWSNVSSGRPGHETPTGTFTVSEKDVDHHSSLYDNASMPFFMRLTDDGLGMHAGFLPGYPASHGCVRLPLGMARELYQRVDSGTPVKITSDPINATLSASKPATALSQL
jgi:hypothetical protein